MITIMQSQVSGERFIISGENRSYREIFTMIAKGFGKKPPYKKVTPLMAEIVWRLEALKAKKFSGKNPLTNQRNSQNCPGKSKLQQHKVSEKIPGIQLYANGRIHQPN